jgi:hypothetical protein
LPPECGIRRTAKLKNKIRFFFSSQNARAAFVGLLLQTQRWRPIAASFARFYHRTNPIRVLHRAVHIKPQEPVPMTTPASRAARGFAAIDNSSPVSSDFSALASHMNDCQRSRGRWFVLRATLESLHAMASPRIVTTVAVFAFCTLGLMALA